MKINNDQKCKSIQEYEELLDGFLRLRLKKVESIMDLLWIRFDMVLRVKEHYVLCILENEIKNRGFSMEDIKDTYYFLCSKKFGVFPQPDRPDPTYTVGIIQTPYPGTGKTEFEIAINIPLFPKTDPRSNNFRNFTIALQNIISGRETQSETTKITNEKNKKYLQSIYLITNSLEPTNVIFLVLDGRFEMPIRCAVKNSVGEPAYIKKLYNIAYFVDVLDKKVDYNRNTADSINNGLFRKQQVAKYMKTNKLEKPTLVQKSEDKKTLVLKNDVIVKTMLVKNTPLQHQFLYIDKTK